MKRSPECTLDREVLQIPPTNLSPAWQLIQSQSSSNLARQVPGPAVQETAEFDSRSTSVCLDVDLENLRLKNNRCTG